MATGGDGGWWRQDRFSARGENLAARARMLAGIRAFFAARGFVEVDTPALQQSPGIEPHLRAFETRLDPPDAGTLYLHTSPEFAMKKILAAGERRIFALARVFRNRERGALHAPEFTMLEWYRAEAPLEALMTDCLSVLALAAEAAGVRRFCFRGREADPLAPAERLTLREAFKLHTGIDLFASLPADGQGAPDRALFASQAGEIGVRVAPDDTWSDIFSRILSDRIEPRLGLGRPCFLTDYPVSQAALARVSPSDPRVAERFELYVCGVELANAFGELTDPAEQRRRFAAEMAIKRRVYGEAYPIDEDFLAALAIMPEASGAALGFDRLVMLACGAERIEDVQWTPVFDPAGGTP
jgi:lysyl-tRNA synthetase class 2